jgi:hypothetical protein
MELKKGPANLGALQEQAIGYGLVRDYMPGWKEHMARGLPYLPERIELGLEGFRLNARAEMLGAKYVTKHAPYLLSGSWRKLNRFEKAHVLANTLRRRRGVPPGPVALENSIVHEVVDGLYGIPLAELASDEPARARARILERQWGFTPKQTRTEFTLVASGLARKAEAEIPLESRDACFNLIDAELRHVAGASGVERAILRWQPVRRTIPTANLHIALALQRLVQERCPKAARFYWNAQWNCGPLYWRQPRHVYLLVEKAADGSMMLATRADSMTEGLADLRSVRYRALSKLRDPLAKHGIFPVGAELAAPWDAGDLEPAAALTVAYFKMLQELGLLDLDKYAWYRRPPRDDTTGGAR